MNKHEQIIKVKPENIKKMDESVESIRDKEINLDRRKIAASFFI